MTGDGLREVGGERAPLLVKDDVLVEEGGRRPHLAGQGRGGKELGSRHALGSGTSWYEPWGLLGHELGAREGKGGESRAKSKGKSKLLARQARLCGAADAVAVGIIAIAIAQWS